MWGEGGVRRKKIIKIIDSRHAVLSSQIRGEFKQNNFNKAILLVEEKYYFVGELYTNCC